MLELKLDPWCLGTSEPQTLPQSFKPFPIGENASNWAHSVSPAHLLVP